MILRGGTVFTRDKTFTRGDVGFKDGAIVFAPGSGCAADLAGDAEIFDAEGLYVLPGLVDIHLHGADGADFSDGTAEALRTLAAYESVRGVTTILPTGMTLPEAQLTAACAAAADFAEPGCARLAGVRLEGPFLSREKCGAQNPGYLQAPDPALFSRLQEAACGIIRIVDIAPELEGAEAFITRFSKDVCISLAHTDADYDTAKKAFDAGAQHVTHLYNGMRPCLHRAPGVPGAAADTDGVTVELIADGVHLHPSTVRSALKLYGQDRVVFISDSMRACGLSDGSYTLGGQDVFVTGPRATLADGTLAGSVTDLAGCLATAVKQMGIPPETAVACCTVNPADALGAKDIGVLERGRRADIVLMDGDFVPQAVFLGGRLVTR